jgi:hypothetical protein
MKTEIVYAVWKMNLNQKPTGDNLSYLEEIIASMLGNGLEVRHIDAATPFTIKERVTHTHRLSIIEDNLHLAHIDVLETA